MPYPVTGTFLPLNSVSCPFLLNLIVISLLFFSPSFSAETCMKTIQSLPSLTLSMLSTLKAPRFSVELPSLEKNWTFSCTTSIAIDSASSFETEAHPAMKSRISAIPGISLFGVIFLFHEPSQNRLKLRQKLLFRKSYFCFSFPALLLLKQYFLHTLIVALHELFHFCMEFIL